VEGHCYKSLPPVSPSGFLFQIFYLRVPLFFLHKLITCYTSERVRGSASRVLNIDHAFIPIGCAIFSRIWGYERQFQRFLKINLAFIPIFRAIFLTDPVFKPYFTPIGCAIFNRIWEDEQSKLALIPHREMSTSFNGL
jgi:hypothetical protein